MSKHNQREKALIYLYQLLLKNAAQLQIDQEDVLNLTPPYQEVVEVILDQKDELIELLDEQLVDWEFKRLGFIEQAILLLACGEIIVIKTPKQVVIDESIRFAKNYGATDTTYKLINATLDKVLDV